MNATTRQATTITHPGMPREPELRDLIKVMFCVSAKACAETAPVAASSSSSDPIVARMLEERPAGQKITWKPPPDGIMNVEVWSSKAGKSQSSVIYFNVKQEIFTITIRIWTDFLCLSGVVIGFAGGRTVVLAYAAITVLAVLSTCRIAGIEQRSLNGVVRIGVNAISRLCRRIKLQVPWTPALYKRIADAFLERDRKGIVSA